MKITEQDLGGHILKSYSLDPKIGLSLNESKDWYKDIRRWKTFLSTIFLPEGYPGSVKPEYLTFQFYDSIQALCSYLRGMLCTQSLLVGMGVGDEAASALSATMMWTIKDGLGMLGGILFAWIGATRFGQNIKGWRLFADISNDIALTLDLLAPLFPDYFLVFISVSSILKAACGVSAGATRAALTQHFSIGNKNLSDIAAKENIQETMVCLVGMLWGAWWAQWLNEDKQSMWIFFAALTIIHVIANYLGMACLVLDSLNSQRAELLITNFIAKATGVSSLTLPSQTYIDLPSPRELAPHDWVMGRRDLAAHRVRLGVGVAAFATSASSTHSFAQVLELFANERYALTLSSSSLTGVLAPDATDEDILKSLFHSILLLHMYGPSSLPHDSVESLQHSLHQTNALFPCFLRSAKRSGWRLEVLLLTTGDARVDWKKSL
jgi:hypothetical protein